METPTQTTKREILVVEDDPSVRDLVVAVLNSEKHDVLTAASVEEARKIIGGGPKDRAWCLVLDVVLRHESGLVFAQELLRQHHDVRVLLISGFTDEIMLTGPENAGRLSFLAKPFAKQDLIGAVARLCA